MDDPKEAGEVLDGVEFPPWVERFGGLAFRDKRKFMKVLDERVKVGRTVLELASQEAAAEGIERLQRFQGGQLAETGALLERIQAQVVSGVEFLEGDGRLNPKKRADRGLRLLNRLVLAQKGHMDNVARVGVVAAELSKKLSGGGGGAGVGTAVQVNVGGGVVEDARSPYERAVGVKGKVQK